MVVIPNDDGCPGKAGVKSLVGNPLIALELSANAITLL